MSQKVLVKHSSVPGKVPLLTDIDMGELALNTYDGKLYAKKDNGTAAIVEIGGAGAAGEMTYHQFVATGAISDGVFVALNTDGTVSVIYQSVTGDELGTPVVFESASTSLISAAYDSASSKIVVAYSDAGNSNFGTAVVGAVSGSSISFGTPVVFESASTNYISAAYDSASSKIVVAYSDEGNSSFGTAVVGAVSGSSISFGTPVVFESASTSFISAAYDSASSKIVVAYRDAGNSNFGTAVVGAVSGSSISFGTPVVFESAYTSYTSAAYDSASSKIVVAYSDAGNSNFGTAVVYAIESTTTNASDWIGIAQGGASDGGDVSVALPYQVAHNLTGLTPNAEYYLHGDGTISTVATDYPVGMSVGATDMILYGRGKV